MILKTRNTRKTNSILNKLYEIRRVLNRDNLENNQDNTQDNNLENNQDNNQDNEELICRLCFEPEERDSSDDLIFLNPCKCIGSMKWIHKKCLLESIEVLNSDICTVCKYQYKQCDLKSSKLTSFLLENKTKISPVISCILLLSLTSFSRFVFLKNKRIPHKTLTSIKLVSLFIMSIHMIICIFKVIKEYIQTQIIVVDIGSFSLIGEGYVFNAYDIMKYYTDIILDKINKYMRPKDIEYMNYTA